MVTNSPVAYKQTRAKDAPHRGWVSDSRAAVSIKLTVVLQKNKRVAYSVAHISAGLTAMRGVEHRPIEGE